MGRSPWAGALALAAWALGAAAAFAWAGAGAAGWRLATAGLACTGAGVLAAAAWWRQPAGLLGWDGARWSWSPGQAPVLEGGVVRAVLDLQASLLLRFEGDGGQHWLWLDRSRLPGRWDALRRAVYSPATHTTEAGVAPPATP